MDQSTFANHLQSPLSMSPALLLAFERLVRVRRFSSVLFKVPHVLGQAQATRITAVFLHLRTNAFYPMTPQDTMRPFCLFSQIRASSHTNTNINIPSSEWATKYLVGNSHESVFARFVMIYCEPSWTAHCIDHLTRVSLLFDPRLGEVGLLGSDVVKCTGLVGHRWEQGLVLP